MTMMIRLWSMGCWGGRRGYGGVGKAVGYNLGRRLDRKLWSVSFGDRGVYIGVYLVISLCPPSKTDRV